MLSLDPPVQCPDSVPCEGFSQQIFFRRKFFGVNIDKIHDFPPDSAYPKFFKSPKSPLAARDFVRYKTSFQPLRNEFSMPATLAATCRSGCAVCQQLGRWLPDQAAGEAFRLLLETPGGVTYSYVITGWADLHEVCPAPAEVLKWERPAPTSRASPQPAPAFSDEATPGESRPNRSGVGGRVHYATNCS